MPKCPVETGASSAASRLIRFDMICEASGIKHRLTQPHYP